MADMETYTGNEQKPTASKPTASGPTASEPTASKIWLITGASKGFGRIWASAALQRGDRVAATARNVAALSDLVGQYGDAILPIPLDVNERDACFAAVDQALAHFGRIDVLINNAGYGHFGFVEEISEAEARQQIDTNLFGSLWLIQAVLPGMRRQQSGHIMQVSSIGGVLAFPNLSIYHATKWAVEGLCESLAQEVAPFGIRVTLIEPAAYATDWATVSASRSVPNDAYNGMREAMQANRGGMTFGRPEATAAAILTVADAPVAPLRLFLGKMPFRLIEPAYQKRLETWEQWRMVSEQAD